MTYILIAAISVVVAMPMFVLGFVVGAKFTKVYLKERGLLLEAPAPKSCGKGSCDCG